MKPKRKKQRYAPHIAIVAAISVAGGGAYALIRNFLASPPNPPKLAIEQIHLIRPPPPPPDLPPPPPPPPEAKVDVPQPEQHPDPTPSNEPPPSDHLGLDAEGGAGSDAFGLVGNKGGRDLVGSGGNAFSWYAGLLKNEILDQLNSNGDARKGQYSLDVRVWIRDDGSVGRVLIVHGSGDRDRDRAIERALAGLTRLSQSPPLDMPEPITLRIVSRG